VNRSLKGIPAVIRARIFLLWIAVCGSAFALRSQTELPLFLTGTWKAEKKDIYEHWDVVGPDLMLGISYSMSGERMLVSEYLTVRKKGRRMIYTATVLDSGSGRSVDFSLESREGDAFTFSNRKHDFPKVIFYEKLSGDTVGVKVTDEISRGFAYRLIRM
jgi:hypothetical protein